MNNIENKEDDDDVIDMDSVKDDTEDDTEDEENDFCLSRFVNQTKNIEPFDVKRFSTHNSIADIKTYVPIHTKNEILNVGNIFLYDKYLYVHQMIPDILHSLSACGKSGKEQFKSSMCEICFTQKVIHVDITARMFYCYNNFKLHPHGTNLVEDKVDFEKVVNIIGNNYKRNALNIIRSSDIINIDHDTIKVCFPGSSHISNFESLNIDHEYWLEKVLKLGKTSKSRDIVTDGVSKRITLGWTQKQPAHYEKVMYYDGKKMPYPSFSINNNEYHFSHCKEIADILSLSQHILDGFYGHEEYTPMHNELRSKLFGYSFGKSFHASCIGRFEFLDIFVEHWSSLH